MQSALLVLSHVYPSTQHDQTGDCPICKKKFLAKSVSRENPRQKNRHMLFPSLSPSENELHCTKVAKTKLIFTPSNLRASIQTQCNFLKDSLHFQPLSSWLSNPVRCAAAFAVVDLTDLAYSSQQDYQTACKLLRKTQKATVLAWGPLEPFQDFIKVLNGVPGLIFSAVLFKDDHQLAKSLLYIKRRSGRCTLPQLMQCEHVSYAVSHNTVSKGQLTPALFV